MRLVTYRTEVAAEARLGAIVQNYVVDLALLGEQGGVYLPDNMLDFIDLGPQAVELTTDLLKSCGGKWGFGVAQPLANVKLLAPIPRPRTILRAFLTQI